MATYYIGVDLGGTNLRCALFDSTLTLLDRSERPTLAAEGSAAVIERLNDAIEEIVRRAGLAKADIGAVGAGFPGPIDQRHGMVHSAPNLPGWKNVPLATVLSGSLNMPVFVENDANCACLGEHALGAGRGAQNMILVTLGTGIGGALIINGSLYTGRDGAAGELGHICVEFGGRQCGCGARGCIEAYGSATSIVRRFVEHVRAGAASALAQRLDAVTCRDIFRAAEAGDAAAGHIVEQTGQYLGVFASSLAETLNPELCVFAGGVVQAGEQLLATVRQTCQTRNGHPGRTMGIVGPQLGQDAGLVGAAAYAMRQGGR